MKTPKIERLEAKIRELALNLAEARLACLGPKPTERDYGEMAGTLPLRRFRKVAKLFAPPVKKAERQQRIVQDQYGLYGPSQNGK